VLLLWYGVVVGSVMVLCCYVVVVGGVTDMLLRVVSVTMQFVVMLCVCYPVLMLVLTCSRIMMLR